MVVGREVGGKSRRIHLELVVRLGQENISGWEMYHFLNNIMLLYIVVSCILSAQSNRTFQFLFLLYIYYKEDAKNSSCGAIIVCKRQATRTSRDVIVAWLRGHEYE